MYLNIDQCIFSKKVKCVPLWSEFDKILSENFDERTFTIVWLFTGTIVISEISARVPGHAVLGARGMPRVSLRVAGQPPRPGSGEPIRGPVHRLHTNVRQSEEKSVNKSGEKLVVSHSGFC